jgi:hypothetical protein
VGYTELHYKKLLNSYYSVKRYYADEMERETYKPVTRSQKINVFSLNEFSLHLI